MRCSFLEAEMERLVAACVTNVILASQADELKT